MKKVRVLDTTLRDGEQSPGAAMDVFQKLEIADRLQKLGVDTIEAGFPASSPKEFEAVSTVAREIRGVEIAGFGRATIGDMDKAWQAIKAAEKPLIHTFISTSDIHIKDKLESTREAVLAKAVEAVSYAKSLCPKVEFTAEDSIRTDRDYLVEIFSSVIKAGADIINIADTVGYATPWEMEDLVKFVCNSVDDIRNTIISVHCHNDMGLAVANSLAAIRAGASQVECTVNGIGERAGNAALEEISMLAKTRQQYLDFEIGINTKEIVNISALVSKHANCLVQPNKAIVGKNAFCHEAGIHQHGILKNPATYEIIQPEDIGLTKSILSLGRRSGKHGLSKRMKDLGYNLTSEDVNRLYPLFIEIAENKKQVEDNDLHQLAKSNSCT